MKLMSVFKNHAAATGFMAAALTGATIEYTDHELINDHAAQRAAGGFIATPVEDAVAKSEWYNCIGNQIVAMDDASLTVPNGPHTHTLTSKGNELLNELAREEVCLEETVDSYNASLIAQQRAVPKNLVDVFKIFGMGAGFSLALVLGKDQPRKEIDLGFGVLPEYTND